MDRVTDARGVIAELPWGEVSRARIAGREPIARFEELLDAWPDARINVDPKHAAAVAPLLDIVERKRAEDRVCIGSFDARRVSAARERFGRAGCTALTRAEVASLWVRSRLAAGPRRGSLRPRSATAASGGRCVQVPVRAGPVFRVDRRLVDRAHLEGLPIHIWTVDAPTEMERLLDLGVDGLMSDDPATLKTVLVRRGAWRDPDRAGPGTIGR